jgi:selenocysteine lyase/cysteine desulfurase
MDHTELPVAFLTIYEHNSNLLTWRETGCIIELVPMDVCGDLDYNFLQQRLEHYKDVNCLKVGSFSAGSNVTGTLVDIDRIAIMCHKNNCLATFDYAAVAPYI